MTTITALRRGLYTSVGHVTLLSVNIIWSSVASFYTHSYVFLAYAMLNVVLLAVHIPTTIHREKTRHFISDEVRDDLKMLQDQQDHLQTNIMAELEVIKQILTKQ